MLHVGLILVVVHKFTRKPCSQYFSCFENTFIVNFLRGRDINAFVTEEWLHCVFEILSAVGQTTDVLRPLPHPHQMQDVAEREQEEELKRQYTRSSAEAGNTKKEESVLGFKVRDAPWSEAQGDFPVLGGGGTQTRTAQWGPSGMAPKLARKN